MDNVAIEWITCPDCGGQYPKTQRDGSVYAHACPVPHNPDTDAPLSYAPAPNTNEVQ